MATATRLDWCQTQAIRGIPGERSDHSRIGANFTPFGKVWSHRHVRIRCSRSIESQDWPQLDDRPVKGAFTGASNNRPGLLMSAHNGLLFLDEIGELGLDEQAMLLRAIEERRFLPVGADRESESKFQLLAGTNRDLQKAVAEGTFREDLLARIDLWTFRLPGLAERREDIEPNLDYELQRISDTTGHRVSMSKEARTSFLSWAKSAEARWPGNFRDLNAAVVRMVTLAQSGRISVTDVEDERQRLASNSRARNESNLDLKSILTPDQLAGIDLFDQVQLAAVVKICRESRTLSDAGRQLFSVSRLSKNSNNDADRLRKFLARFGLSWNDLMAE